MASTCNGQAKSKGARSGVFVQGSFEKAPRCHAHVKDIDRARASLLYCQGSGGLMKLFCYFHHQLVEKYRRPFIAFIGLSTLYSEVLISLRVLPSLFFD